MGELNLQHFDCIMVDIETTGLRPDRHAIIQIAAVPFSVDRQEISESYFDMCLRIPSTRGWQETTRDWWHGTNLPLLKEILGRAQPAQHVMQCFRNFLSELAPKTRFWGKRSFDWQFIESYFHDTEVGNPLSYKNAIEVESFMQGLAFPNPMPNVRPEFEGIPHHAYWDTKHQIRTLFAIINELKGGNNAT